MKWWHHLTNPHCEECRHDRECSNCEVLRQEIEAMRFERDKLITALIQKNIPITTPVTSNEQMQGIKPRLLPWSSRRQQLELADRIKAAEQQHTDRLKKEAAAKSVVANPAPTNPPSTVVEEIREDITLEELEAEMHRAESERTSPSESYSSIQKGLA